MRSSGKIEYMTPLQIATESSTVPKSVMKTTVGGYCSDVCCATADPKDSSRKRKDTDSRFLLRRILTVIGGLTVKFTRSTKTWLVVSQAREIQRMSVHLIRLVLHPGLVSNPVYFPSLAAIIRE
jgi:hypothetical protein